MTTLDNATVASAPVLRRLYFVRVGFAVVWAVLLGVTASDLGVVAGVLALVGPECVSDGGRPGSAPLCGPPPPARVTPWYGRPSVPPP